MAVSQVPDALGFDPEQLRARYRAEREKRLRSDGIDQYLQVSGAFARYDGDPYVAPGFTRAPLHDEVEVLLIGGGFGGLLAGARLREAGIEPVRIIEKGGDFGGTWYWNRYPGAMCDVESYVYLPLLEELGTMPSEKYARAPEILAHCQALGRAYDLYRDACFQTEVTELRWDPAAARWIASTDRGDRIRARFVVMSTGPLNRPKLPGIPGIESFAGHSFHTSRWDYAYTGGDANGKLSLLRDKRVGIIGTGATAVQCVPHLGEAAARLYVFQRTPSSIDVRDNRPTDPDWVRSLQPGWHQQRMDNFNTLVSGGFAAVDLVNDGWTDLFHRIMTLMQRDPGVLGNPLAMLELADFQKMEQIRARVDALVQDPRTAEALKPYYRQLCKRPCFHDEYLQTFNRPNVMLVDTKGKGVERISERGVVVEGVEYAVDCLIYATGFEVGTEYRQRAGYEVYGRGGLSLTEKWADGVRTLHGMHSRGFPNCFIMGPQQGGFTINYPHGLDEQSRHLAYIVQKCRARGARTIEVGEAAEAEWVATILRLSGMAREFQESCTPGYYNNEGRLSERAAQNGFFGGGSIAFFQLLREWREEGSLQGMELG